MITIEQLLQIAPLAGRERAGQFVEPLNRWMPAYGLTTPARQAAFLAQVAHESGQLRCGDRPSSRGGMKVAPISATRSRAMGSGTAAAA